MHTEVKSCEYSIYAPELLLLGRDPTTELLDTLYFQAGCSTRCSTNGVGHCSLYPCSWTQYSVRTTCGLIEKVSRTPANLDHDKNDDHQLKTRMMLVFEVISQKFNQSDTLM